MALAALWAAETFNLADRSDDHFKQYHTEVRRCVFCRRVPHCGCSGARIRHDDCVHSSEAW